MNERAFRLDFVIAMGALLVSALTAGTLLYQTHVISAQYAATIWPYLSVETTNDPHGIKVEISNDGLGPALIRSAQLAVDGKNMPSWDAVFPVVARDPEVRKMFLSAIPAVRAGLPSPLMIRYSSIGRSTTLRSGQSRTLLSVNYTGEFPGLAIAKHRVAMDFCYCSLNASCWKLNSVLNGEGGSDPQPVSHCTSSADIGSTLPSPAPHPPKR